MELHRELDNIFYYLRGAYHATFSNEETGLPFVKAMEMVRGLSVRCKEMETDDEASSLNEEKMHYSCKHWV